MVISVEEKADRMTAITIKGLAFDMLEHEAVGSGRVVDPWRARLTPCTCFTHDSDRYAWSEGVIGLISEKKTPQQFEDVCALGCIPSKAVTQKKFEKMKMAIVEARDNWKKNGGGVSGWWQSITDSFQKHGVEV